MSDQAALRFWATMAAAFVACVVVPIAAAAEPPLDFNFKPDGTFAPFKSKTAKELMTDDKFQLYQKALRKLDCRNAVELLNAAFVREYPQFLRARRKPNVYFDQDFEAWEYYAGSEYDGYGFCTSHSSFKEADSKLRKEGRLAPKYKHFEPHEQARYENREAEVRDLSLRSMLSKADKDYPPALIVFAELVRRGDLFDAGPDMEFYLITRACHLGHDCAELRERLDELGDMLPATRREELTEQARAERSVVEQAFVHGGKP